MLAAGIGVLCSASLAPAGPTGASDNATVELVSDVRSVKPGQPFTVGLVTTLDPGWHTYWKNPGDAGLPLRIDWKLPEGFSAGPIEWPAPMRMPGGGEMSYGYAGTVLLPVRITPPETIREDTVTVAGTFRWLECAEVCVSASATLDLALPVKPEDPAPGHWATVFRDLRLPQEAPGLALKAEAGPRAIALFFRLPEGGTPRDPYLFVEEPMVADYAAKQPWERVGDRYRLTVKPAPNAAGPPSRLTGVLVLQAEPPYTAILVDVPVSAGDPAPAREKGGFPVWVIALYSSAVALMAAAWVLWNQRRTIKPEGRDHDS
jgi:thiol:disulfide interchange protein DsbD